jgi:outer membrane lipoprotein-sorting protein
MTDAPPISRRDFLLLVGAGVAAAAMPGPLRALAQERTMTLERLLRAFSSMPGLSAKFTEEKRMAMLAVPLTTEGEILFAPPDRLLRKVTSPTRSTALLVGDHLPLDAGGRRQEMDLSQNAVVEGFVDTFRHVLAGDQAALERTYRVSFEATDGGWRLTLRPRTRALRRFLRDMVLEGDGSSLRTMTMNEANGDISVTTFSDVNAHRRFSDAETTRLFRL